MHARTGSRRRPGGLFGVVSHGTYIVISGELPARTSDEAFSSVSDKGNQRYFTIVTLPWLVTVVDMTPELSLHCWKSMIPM